MKSFRWIVSLAMGCAYAAGQTVTLTHVALARETLVRAKGLTEAEKGEISGLYDQAVKSLQEENRWRAQQVGHTRAKTLISNELTAARASAASPLPAPAPTPLSETSQQVEEEVERVRNDRASRIKVRDDLSKVQATLSTRRGDITARRAAIRETLQSIEDEFAVLPLAAGSPQWESASRTAIQARRQALEQELQTLATEREALELRQQIIPLQREAQLLQMEADDQLIDELTARKTIARMQDGKKSMDAAIWQAKALAAQFPELSSTADDIASRATALWGANGIEAKTDKVALQSDQMKASLVRFREITVNTVRRYQNASLFSPASDWWPSRVETFGNPFEVRLALFTYSAAESSARRDLFQLEEERDGAPPLEKQVQQLVSASGRALGDPAFQEFTSGTRSLLELRRKVMREFLTDTRNYVEGLGEAHRTARDLLSAIQQLEIFVFQRVLWTRSVAGPIFPSVTLCARAVLWFFSYRGWSQIIAGFKAADVRAAFWIAGLTPVFALFLFRKRVRGRLNRSRLQHPKGGRVTALFSSILLALLYALPAPLAIAYVGWMIGALGERADLGRAVGAGARSAAVLLYFAVLARSILEDGGATDRLMGWNRDVRKSLDYGIKRLMLVCTPLFAVSAALAHEGMFFDGDSLLQSYHASLGRFCFMAAVLYIFHIGLRALKTKTPVSSAIATRFSKSSIAWARVSRWAWNLLCFLTFVLALLGFYTTAYILVHNLIRTAALTFALALAAVVIRQWRLDQQDKALVSRSPDEEQQVRKADQQVRKLSHFALTLVWIVATLLIWSAALPALSLLRTVELLPEFTLGRERAPSAYALTATEDAPKAERQEPPSQPSRPFTATPTPSSALQPREPLYLSDVLLAIFVGILTSMLVTNIPGLLHFTLLPRLQLDEGGLYAVTTIARYIVIIIGLLSLSSILGLNWSKVQWLAAALTFGIGFGLQEIFANFASGLILLLDRSIRVGDAVTVGTLSGVVARIQMRATTVTLWDRSDMVVPNKEFITSKVVNWTLSHPDTRVDLKVGIEYESDVETVREVLMRIAEEHPATLKYPAPQVLLTQFGESAMLFELRVFALFSYGRNVLLDELHRAVVREFRRLGIVIAYPHVDVQLNTTSLAHKA